MRTHFLIPLFFSVLLSSCSESTSEQIIEPTTPIQTPNAEQIDVLWKDTVSVLLTEDIWSERDKYDMAHVLLQPMQYAFASSEQNNKQDEFDQLFTRMEASFEETDSSSRVATTQFLYFVSEYLVLKYKNQQNSEVVDSLTVKLTNWWTSYVNSEAWMWNNDPFDTLWQRIQWKIETPNPELSYYRAIIDEEFYLFGIMSNLIYANEQITNSNNQDFVTQIEIGKPLLDTLLNNEITYVGAAENEKYNWYFQQGVWWQHRDYAYAGHLEFGDDLEPARLENIVTDSAHMHRWPVWLDSYARAFATDNEMQELIKKLKLGYTQQFNDVVYVPSSEEFSGPRINNYFNGHNGLYRYGYETLGGTGYGPYQNSGLIFYGWYGNLENAEQLKMDIESLINGGFNISASLLEIYAEPNTTRERNPLVTLPNYYSNGMAELNIRVTLELLN